MIGLWAGVASAQSGGSYGQSPSAQGSVTSKAPMKSDAMKKTDKSKMKKSAAKKSAPSSK